ncbi:hypothetical protein [Streptomyces sp. NPDC060194]|uniref:hypothetical protein n=1 Tax=Streptomyces sp. NPDC060194 TaxID=3347069 RepID=UPI0036585D29
MSSADTFADGCGSEVATSVRERRSVRHDDCVLAEPADPAAGERAGADAVEFFRRWLG